MTQEERIKYMQEAIDHKENVITNLLQIKNELLESLNHACSKVKQLEITIKELERKIYVGTPPD
tara:strand:+ start:2088 stop:2279 length:192 start_codon:yes stop_codon:yes gene_type:complete